MASSFTLVTWNVNGLRARRERLLGWLTARRPDIVCLQETKIPDDLFPVEDFTALGYHCAFSGQKGFNGVAVISRRPLENVSAGLWDAPPVSAAGDAEKRLMAVTTFGIRVVCVYVPNGESPDSPKFSAKLAFLAGLKDWLVRHHRPGEPLALCGDLNIAPQPRDVYSVEAMEGQIGFHPQEHAALEAIRTWGFVDMVRAFNPQGGLYSWWDYRGGGLARNLGLRIDHIWATMPLAARGMESWIDKTEREAEKPSDHAPVGGRFSLLD